MNGLEKFRELLLTDVSFQEKLKDAVESYTGDKTEEALFNSILVPLASEYGISATYEEFKSYKEQFNDQELNTNEIAQVAGGDSKDFGAAICCAIGAGAGFTGGDEGNACFLFGVGLGGAQACCGSGS